jgi:hypothetical protein
MAQKGISFGVAFALRAVFYQRTAWSSKRITMSSRFMKINTNIAANAEPGVQTEDFAERVRVNQAQLTSELAHTTTSWCLVGR